MRTLEETPTHCSSCFNQDPSTTHIDLDASWDGPVIDNGSGVKQVIDDLVLCEGCVREAYKMLPAPSFEVEVELQNRIKELETTIATKERRIETLTAAVAAKDQDKKPRAKAKVSA